MLIIAGHYLVDASQRDAYVEANQDLVTRARAAPGCLDVAITADTIDPGRVNMYERWDDEDTLAAFRAVADPPTLDVEMRDMQVSKFSVDRETDPFDEQAPLPRLRQRSDTPAPAAAHVPDISAGARLIGIYATRSGFSSALRG